MGNCYDEKRPRVLIEVRGGIAEQTEAEGPEVETLTLDWDCIEAGDEPPYSKPHPDDMRPISKRIRDAWNAFEGN